MAIQMKTVLMGDAAVGKTAIRERYMGKGFSSSYLMTTGADFALKKLEVSGYELHLQIWDLAGHPRFDGVRKLYYQGATGGLVLFDITRRHTFDNVLKWIDEFWKSNGKDEIPLVLLGNKSDLRDQFPDSVTDEEGIELAKQITEYASEKGFEVSYLLTSAKTGLNIDVGFESLAKEVLALFYGKK